MASLATTFAIFSSVFTAISAQAVEDGTVNCGTSGTFTIVSNIVTTNTNCRGSLTIPEGVTEIARGAFGNAPDRASYITSIIFPNSLTTIQESAFRAASSLTSINFGTGLQSIVHWNFADSTALTEVTIPSTVTSLGVGVFYLSSQLETVTFLGNAPSTSSFTFGSVKAGAVANISSGATGFGAVGSTWSNLLVSAASAPPATTAPDAPTIGTATALSPTSASISFTAPTSNGGATIETYTATSTPGSFTGQLLQAGSGSITVTGLSSSTAYTFTVTASAAAAVRREAEKKSARSEILDKFRSSEKVTIETFAQAEIAGITKENIEAASAEILALPEESRSDILQVIKIAYKYEVVGKIASEQVSTVYSSELIEVGLISSESKHRATLTAALRKLPAPQRSSYAQIEVALNALMETIQARKDRLAAVIARNAARNAA